MGDLVLLRSFDVSLIKSSQGVLIGGATWSDCASGRSGQIVLQEGHSADYWEVI